MRPPRIAGNLAGNLAGTGVAELRGATFELRVRRDGKDCTLLGSRLP
jgi:hypothetical protein